MFEPFYERLPPSTKTFTKNLHSKNLFTGEKGMKGQMFIVTIIFLVGMIFAVQQSLLRYSEVESTDPFFLDDNEIIINIENSLLSTLQLSPSCEEAGQNIQELVNKLTFGRRRGFRIDIRTEMDCSNWKTSNPVLKADVAVEGRSVNSRKHMEFVV